MLGAVASWFNDPLNSCREVDQKESDIGNYKLNAVLFNTGHTVLDDIGRRQPY
jgi:hypothetical protein